MRKAKEPAVDNVNRPQHYTFGAIEVIDAIEAWDLGFHLGNVVECVALRRLSTREVNWKILKKPSGI